MLLSKGPSGGGDSNTNEISLSSEIFSICGVLYNFFSIVFRFTTDKNAELLTLYALCSLWLIFLFNNYSC